MALVRIFHILRGGHIGITLFLTFTSFGADAVQRAHPNRGRHHRPFQHHQGVTKREREREERKRRAAELLSFSLQHHTFSPSFFFFFESVLFHLTHSLNDTSAQSQLGSNNAREEGTFCFFWASFTLLPLSTHNTCTHTTHERHSGAHTLEERHTG